MKFAGTKSNTVGNTTYQDGRYTYNHTQVVKPMTAVNAATSTQLQNAVNGLSAAGATAVDWGLEHAQSQLANTSSDRNKVVIVFTDGEPNHGSGFSDSVANSALSTAKTLKDGCLLYTSQWFHRGRVAHCSNNIRPFPSRTLY